MIDHIYGRTNIMDCADRPNLFVAELNLYINFIKEQLEDECEPDVKKKKYYTEYFKNLQEGISYYRNLLPVEELHHGDFMQGLNAASQQITALESEFSHCFTEKVKPVAAIAVAQ